MSNLGYSDFVTASADLLVILETITDPTSATPSTDPNFNKILPWAITYAENRMYRELDLLQTEESATSLTTALNRAVSIPSGMIIMNSVYLITPAGANPNDLGSERIGLLRTSLDHLNWSYPYGSALVVGQKPKYFASKSDSTIFLGPAPDNIYNVEFYGIFRPTPLSATNTTTILTSYLPDCFLACAMVFFSGYQRDFGAQSDDPRMAQSWEQQYQTLKMSAMAEIARAKQQGELWQPYSSATQATSSNRGH